MRQIPGWFIVVSFVVMLWVFFVYAAPVIHDVSIRLALRGVK